MYPSFFDELEQIDQELEKKAIAPLLAGGFGLLSHLGSNLLVKGLHSKRFMQKARAGLFAQGISGGISGKPQSLLHRMLQTNISPEVFVPEQAGRLLGSELATMSKGRQIRTLKKLRKATAMLPELQHTPVFEDVVGGINRTLEKGVPKMGVPMEPSMLSKALPFALGPAAALAGEPGALIHAGLNAGRQALAGSSAGKKYMQHGFTSGLKAPIQEGGRTRAIDALVSPAALNSQRIGSSLRNIADKYDGPAIRLMGSAEPLIRGNMHKITGYIDRLDVQQNIARRAGANPYVAQLREALQSHINDLKEFAIPSKPLSPLPAGW